jgi:hypothetical protein
MPVEGAEDAARIETFPIRRSIGRGVTSTRQIPKTNERKIAIITFAERGIGAARTNAPIERHTDSAKNGI